VLTDYAATIAALSQRIVQAQKPIRILDAIKWSPEIKETFFKNKAKELPKVDINYYNNIPLGFDVKQKHDEFSQIAQDVRRQLGTFSGISQILLRICDEYKTVVNLLAARGTPEFTRISQQLYGSASDVFHAGAPSLNDLADLVSDVVDVIKSQVANVNDEKIYSSEEAAVLLNERLSNYFYDDHNIRVELSDGIIADAAAGAERIKLRRGARFSRRDIDVLEVHEGWVHLGTTLNGLSQPICTFLSKGPPSATITQEGLAIIMEIFTFSSHPLRIERLTDRIKVVNLAEKGANFLEIYRFLQEKGINDDDSYVLASRVFRGCSPESGPFTKDLAYSKGFVLIYNYIRLAIQRGLLRRISLLFLGKTTLEDLPVLEDLLDEKLIIPPRYVPPQFQDMASLSAWMCYSLFLNQLDLKRMAADYKGLLQQ